MPAVRVAAASDLRFALDAIVADYRRDHPNVEIRTTYGSSGSLYAQIANGGPYDVFLSADLGYPRQLIEAGLARRDRELVYAIGQIVVWTPKDSPIDVEKLGIQAIVDPRVRKIAIANPRHAPYGRAAEAALRKLGVYEQVKDRLVLAENIAQAAQFVESGSADVGILAMSSAVSPALRDRGRYWPIPADAHPAIEQGGVVLDAATDPETAAEFARFLTSEPARTILKQNGFLLPGES